MDGAIKIQFFPSLQVIKIIYLKKHYYIRIAHIIFLLHLNFYYPIKV